MKIFLIGYMGSGKSTVGKKLARLLQMDFVDLDDYIEKEYGKSISDIFQQEGEKKFRELEHHYIQLLIEREVNLVIALGGGTPCFHDHMKLINDHGISVYLKMSVDGLVHRLMNGEEKRPLIQGMGAGDLKTYITEHLATREPFYMQAHYKVKAKDMDVKELAGFIEDRMKS